MKTILTISDTINEYGNGCISNWTSIVKKDLIKKKLIKYMSKGSSRQVYRVFGKFSKSKVIKLPKSDECTIQGIRDNFREYLFYQKYKDTPIGKYLAKCELKWYKGFPMLVMEKLYHKFEVYSYDDHLDKEFVKLISRLQDAVYQCGYTLDDKPKCYDYAYEIYKLKYDKFNKDIISLYKKFVKEIFKHRKFYKIADSIVLKNKLEEKKAKWLIRKRHEWLY